jgi:TATA-binding protein-associated factor
MHCLAQAAKRVVAQHRLILSGTPIQNNVLELWALFDFLMPGFLGSHAAFQGRYGRALAAPRGSKAGSAEAQAGLLAMEGLHKQVCFCHYTNLYFMYSRVKVQGYG